MPKGSLFTAVKAPSHSQQVLGQLMDMPSRSRCDRLTAQEALLAMDDSALTVEQLDALSRAVPEDQELKDIHLYLQAPPAAPPAP